MARSMTRILLLGALMVTVISLIAFWLRPNDAREQHIATDAPRPAPDAGPTAPPPPRDVPLPHGLGWRGDGSGRYPDARPPLQWSPTKHVVWKAPLPSRGNATPVVLGNRIFITAEPDLLLAIDATDGRVLWQRQVTLSDALAAAGDTQTVRRIEEGDRLKRSLSDAEAEEGRLKREARKEGAAEAQLQLTTLQATIASLKEKLAQGSASSGAPPGSFVGDAAQTPVTDGRSVFVAYGSFVAAAYDLDGARRWIRFLPHPEPTKDSEERHGIGGSPLLAGDRLVIPMVQLYGLDPDTGAITWTVPGINQWGTPTRVTLAGVDHVVTSSGKVIRAWDGKLMAELIVPLRFVGPISQGALVILSGLDLTPGASHISQVEALQFPEPFVQGSRPTTLWKQAVGHGDYYGTPTIDGDRMFAFNDEGHRVQVLDLKTGALLHERALPVEPGMPIPSLAVAGKTLHISFEQGGTYVLSTEAPYRELAHNQIEDTIHASPIFEGPRMYLRTFQTLYCFAER